MDQLKVGVFNVLAAGMCGCSEIYKNIQEEEKKKDPQTSQGLDYAQEIFDYLLYLSCFGEKDKTFFTSLVKLKKQVDKKVYFETKLLKLCGETNKGKEINNDANRTNFIKHATIGVPQVLLNLLNIQQLQTVINKEVKKLNDKSENLSVEEQQKLKSYNSLLQLTDNNKLKNYLEYCTLKESILGKIIKEFCQSFPFDGGNGFGLYGGFKLGLDDPKHDIMSTGFRNDFYQKKADFMVKQIKNFFADKDYGILVCPEYDYGDKLDNDYFYTKNTKNKQVITIKGITNGSNINSIPCGNYKDPSKEDENTKFLSITGSQFKPQSINTEANFFRYVFFQGIKLELKNGEYEKQLDLLKTCWKKETEPDKKKKKNRVDVFYGYNENETDLKNIKFVFIGVHLDSTTSIDDNYKKKKEIEGLETLVEAIKNKLKPNQKPNQKIQIIIAGDFNFPYFLNEEKKKIEGSDNYIIPGFNSGGAVDVSKIEYWNYFKNNYKLSSPQRVGVCTKERFKSEMGNDQLWEGKGDKRSYNTDFIGSIEIINGEFPEYFKKIESQPEGLKIKKLQTIFGDGSLENVPKPEENANIQVNENTLIDVRNQNLLNENTLFPYVGLVNKEINIDESWLSDHSLVFSTINLQTVLSGGARKSRLLRNIKKTNTNNNRNNRKKNNNKSTKKRKMNNRKKLSRKKNKKMRIKSKKN